MNDATIRDAVFEAIAERLGEHPKAYNEFDPSDEPVTCITLKGVPVEVLAEFIAPALAALAVSATGEVEIRMTLYGHEEGDSDRTWVSSRPVFTGLESALADRDKLLAGTYPRTKPVDRVVIESRTVGPWVEVTP